MPSNPNPTTPPTPANVVPMLPPNEQPPRPRFSDPKNFINRELSWLGFNRRVFEEAQDPAQPLLERVKFLGIVSSNLDEFFEIRVAGIKQQIASETSDVGPDGMSPTETFQAIERVAHQMVQDQYALWNDQIPFHCHPPSTQLAAPDCAQRFPFPNGSRTTCSSNPSCRVSL